MVGFSEDLGMSHSSNDGVSAKVELKRISGNEYLTAELCDDHVNEETSVDLDHAKEETVVDLDQLEEETSVDILAVDDGTCLDTAIEEDLKQEATVMFSTPTTGVALQNDKPSLDLPVADKDDSVSTKLPVSSSVFVSEEGNVSVDEKDTDQLIGELVSSHAAMGEGLGSVMSSDVKLKRADSDNDIESVTDRGEEHQCKSVPSSDKAEGCTGGVEIAKEESGHKEEVEGTHATTDAAGEECRFEKEPTAEEVVVDSDVGGADPNESSNGSSVDAVSRPAPGEDNGIQSSEKTSQELPADDVDPVATQLTRI